MLWCPVWFDDDEDMERQSQPCLPSASLASGQDSPVSVPQPGDVLAASYRVSPTNAAPYFADAEAPVGVIDGSNMTFTLGYAPSPVTSVRVYRNGILNKLNTDYTLSGQSIQFLTGAVPQAGDTLLVYYRY